MLTHKSFRFRVYPTAAQAARLEQWEHALRALWNAALDQRLQGLARWPKRYFTFAEQCRELTAARAANPWLADVPRNVCEYALRELDLAWQRCFKRLARAPRFKRKGRDSVAMCEAHGDRWRVDATLRFPRIGAVRVVAHRELEGTPKSCSLVRDGDQWFAAIMCVVEHPAPEPRAEPVVALDRGIVNLVADSDGRIVPGPAHYEHALARLRRAQRTVSRRRKGSNRRERAKLRVARIHRKIRRQREHFAHVLSYRYAKSHGTVIVEDLRIGNMVRVGSGLARRIADAGWGQLVRCLRYKLAWSGGQLVEVPAQYSSRTCHACGVVDRASRSTQDTFACVGCGLSTHADLNAARVLLGRRRTSCAVLPAEGIVLKAPRRSGKLALA